MQQYKIDEETANEEFTKICDFMDVFVDESKLNEEDQQSYDKQKGHVVEAIRRGFLEVDEDGQPAYTTKKGQKLTIHEIDGSALLALDTVKRGQDSRKLFKLIQEVTKSSVKATELNARDIRILGAMVGLFLAM